jgi:hypothetical protein
MYSVARFFYMYLTFYTKDYYYYWLLMSYDTNGHFFSGPEKQSTKRISAGYGLTDMSTIS